MVDEVGLGHRAKPQAGIGEEREGATELFQTDAGELVMMGERPDHEEACKGVLREETLFRVEVAVAVRGKRRPSMTRRCMTRCSCK